MPKIETEREQLKKKIAKQFTVTAEQVKTKATIVQAPPVVEKTKQVDLPPPTPRPTKEKDLER